MPPVTWSQKTYTLAADTAEAYCQMLDELEAELPDGMNFTEATGRCADLVAINHAGRIAKGRVVADSGEMSDTDRGARRKVLEEILSGIGFIEPVVVFGWHHSDLDDITAAAANVGMACGERSGRRDQLAEWQNGDTQILATQLSAGALGVDMTRARYAVFFAGWWSPDMIQQATARVHRAGQTRPVSYIAIVAELPSSHARKHTGVNTLEQIMWSRVRWKWSEQQDVIDRITSTQEAGQLSLIGANA